MKKRNNLFYWVVTVFLAFGMLSQGVAQILHTKGYVEIITTHLGYPLYFLNIIGVWKILGVAAILIPGFPLVKEWAYAGFAIEFLSASISYIAVDGLTFNCFIPFISMTVLIVSYFTFHKKQKIDHVIPGLS